MGEETWHSRHQRAEDLSSYSVEQWQERSATDCMVFVARGSGRMHDAVGDGIEDGEWRVDVYVMAPLNGPEAFISLSFPWEEDIAKSSTMESLGGIALDLASCERLAEAAAHAAAVLRAGRWVPRSEPADGGATSGLKDQAIAELSDDREKLRQRVAQLEAELQAERTYSIEDFL